MGWEHDGLIYFLVRGRLDVGNGQLKRASAFGPREFLRKILRKLKSTHPAMGYEPYGGVVLKKSMGREYAGGLIFYVRGRLESQNRHQSKNIAISALVQPTRKNGTNTYLATRQ